MDLTIGFLPKKYFSKSPSSHGGYPFFVSERLLYSLNIGEMYYPEIPDKQLIAFTESLAPYPLYYLFELNDEDDYKTVQQMLVENDIIFETLYTSPKSTFLLTTIHDSEELAHLIPTLIWQHNYNMSTFWSPHKHAFTIEKKTWNYGKYVELNDTVCINFNQPTTVFWLGHDFHGTDIYSNEGKFTKLGDVQQLLPTFIKTEIIEFE
ncbi:hypothetical protein ACIQ7N_18805 [Lysinibacillus sp. NPDC095746]|uniref:hypothetical protein n=1 Tax=Lysinibacillus sp. NPDC095746 TaxID=3364134 RepID=UPI0038297999